MTVGTGEYRYQVVQGWGKEPEGRTMGIISGLATDSHDRVYVLDREPSPAVVVFDREGRFLDSWGHEVFPLPHGIWIGPDDRIYIADCRDHTLRICDTEGKVLSTIGTPGRTGKLGEPFNQPTRAACSSRGDIYVSDGYGQHRVHRFSSRGELLSSWGEKGPRPGKFGLPHSVFVSADGMVFVADREPNHCICIFDSQGTFLAEWGDVDTPCDIYVDQAVYVAEGHGRISIFSREGELLSRWDMGAEPGEPKGGAHAIWKDSHGDLYVAGVGTEDSLSKYSRC